jgi:hypothetical protein
MRPDPLRLDHVVVWVRGNRGHGRFVRNSWDSAIHTARHYAELFDAPRSVI